MTQPDACLRSACWAATAPSGWRARCPAGGRIVSLEFSPRHAEVAQANLKSAGLLRSRGYTRGTGSRQPAGARFRARRPFDLIFIDADKANNPHYLEWALKLSRRGTVIVVDNIVRHGQVIDAESNDPDIQGTRRCLEMMAADPRLSAFAMQTVGVKGLDGFAMAVVQ